MTTRRRKKNEPIEIEGPEFRCHFMEMHQYPTLNMNDPEEELGTKPVRFHGSNFWNVKGFGTSRWVLGGYIVVDWDSLANDGYTNEEIFKGCAKFLNKPPERKRFQKRIKRPYEPAINCLTASGIPEPLERINRIPKHDSSQVILSDGFNVK